jgi:hypothetical protein
MGTNLLLLDSYKKIEDLIAYSFSFSNKTNRSLKIVYVFDFEWMRHSFLIGSVGTVDPKLVSVEKNAKKEFDVAEEKIREVAAEYMKEHSINVPFEIHVSELNRIDLVQEEAESISDLMLLISNHQSYSEASGGLLGYPNLVEHVDCPVFVIPENIRQSVMNKIVYATDYNPEDIDSLKHLSGLMKYYPDSSLTILHNEKDHDFGEKLKWKGFMELVRDETDIKIIEFSLKVKKDMLSAIEEYVKENDPDMLVILREKRGFFEEIFTGSETKSVLTHFHKPVLVYHERS